MRMPKTRTNWPLGSIVAAISCCLLLVFVGTASSKQAPKAKSREYKIRLRAADFANDKQREKLWRIVAGRKADTPVSEKALEEKKCRRVSYLDTPSRGIERSGRVLRRREKLGDAQCKAAQAVEVETSFKARGNAAKINAVLEESWATNAKVEEDRLVGRGSSPSTVLSVSADAEGQAELSKVKGVRKLFEGALPNLDPDDEVSASCRVVLERRWELEQLEVSKKVEGPELALWYWNKDGSAAPWLAELSFSVELKDGEAVKAADKLEARLVKNLAKHLAKPGSKTEAVYACSGK